MKSLPVMVAMLALGVSSVAQTPAQVTPAPVPTPTSSSKPQPQARTQEEYAAYQQASAKTDAPSKEAAADEFAQKFPASELRTLLYNEAQRLYRDAGNSDKVIAVGRKSLAIDSTNPVPNVLTAYALVQTTRDTDVDRDAKLSEAQSDAQRALSNLNTGLVVSPSATPEQMQTLKNTIQIMAYETMGGIAMQRKDYAAAETLYQKGVDVDTRQPDGVLLLRLAVAQDNQEKYAAALDSANKAIAHSEPGSQEQEMAKQERTRLQKLLGAPQSSPDPAGQPPQQ